MVGLGHWFNRFGLRVNFGSGSSSFLLVDFVFPATRTPIRPAAAGAIDQCDQVEEELGPAQSKPTHGRRKRSFKM